MLDSNVAYLILVMALFGLSALLLMHHHRISEKIRTKRNAVDRAVALFNKKADNVEAEVKELRDQISAVDDELLNRSG